MTCILCWQWTHSAKHRHAWGGDPLGILPESERVPPPSGSAEQYRAGPPAAPKEYAPPEGRREPCHFLGVQVAQVGCCSGHSVHLCEHPEQAGRKLMRWRALPEYLDCAKCDFYLSQSKALTPES